MKLIAIAGLGKMGGDWAAMLLGAGHRVIGYDAQPQSFGTAQVRIEKGVKWLAKKFHNADQEFIDQAMSRLELFASEPTFCDVLHGADIYLECIIETLAAKEALLAAHAPKLSDHCVLWTNTSGLSVERLARASGRGANFLGAHGMNPVYIMPGVELIRHQGLDSAALKMSHDLLTEAGKMPFVAADVPGFWVNKHWVPFKLDAIRAFERGEISVEDGDRGFNASLGHRQGVFKVSDLVGLDTGYRVALAMYHSTQDPRYYPPRILEKMIARGDLGQKSGRGFYEWDGYKIVKARDLSDLLLPADFYPA